ncbi:MAG: HAD family phosphatase [Candidatus Coatesbacteria bacterium]|nr:MAG: HAD family phosphatase [Candidatus Coatesbacteria bacterium]
MQEFLEGYRHPLKLIVADLDGCLTGYEEGPVDAVGLAELRLWNDRAAEDSNVPPLVLISGRPMGYVEAFARIIGAPHPCIFENGCGMYRSDGGLGHEYAFHPVLIADTEADGAVVILNEYFEEHLIKSKGCGRIIGKKYAISLTPCPGGTVEELMAAVEKAPAELLDKFYITRSISVVDITPAGINKGSGFDWLIDVLRDDYGFDFYPDNVLGIGDSWGDLPFLEKCGVSTAPANAAAEIRERVDYVSVSNEVHAVLDIIAGAVVHNKRLAELETDMTNEKTGA